MSRPVRPRLGRLRIARRALLLIAVGCLGWVIVMLVRMHLSQQELRQELAAALERQDAVSPAGSQIGAAGSVVGDVAGDTLDPRMPRAYGDLVGRIQIPRVELDVMVLEGVRDYLLDKGAGHFPETPLPGLGGNAAFAGHRDTFFRPLRRVDEGDTVHVTVPWGRYHYTVDSIQIIDPEDVWVLDPHDGERLTLITCYPFDWLGPAPRRVMVAARPLSDSSFAAPFVDPLSLP